MKKRVVLGILILALLILGGCKKETPSTEENVSSGKDYVYRFENLSDKLENREISQSVILSDRIVFMEYRYEDSQIEARAEEEAAEEEAYEEYTAPQSFVSIIQCDFEGNILSEFEMEQPADSGIHAMCADEGGNAYLVMCEYGKDTTNPEMIKDVYTLLGYSPEGEERYRVALGQEISEEEYFYVNNMLCGKNGDLFLWRTGGIDVYDGNCTYVKTISLEEEEAGNMYCLRDGSLAIQYYGQQNQYFRTVNMETGEFSEKIELPYNSYNYAHFAGKTCDFMLADSIGVYTYSFGDTGIQKIMDFVDSDLSTDTCYSVTQLSEESFFAGIFDSAEGMSKFGIFTKVDPASIPEKKVLTLGVLWLDNDVRSRVVEFNKNNEEYRIHVEDYNKYNTSEDYMAGSVKLNTDIATGNVPDIICLSQDMPIQSYMSKGLFADLYTFLEKDPELKKEDYMTEVLEAFSYDGKWYQLVPSYYLYTVWGKTADVGKEPGLSFDELKTLRSKKGEEVIVFSEQTKSSVINQSMMFNSNQFIDWETGSCYFNTPEFIELLEFANEFPKEINYEDLYEDPDYWESQETVFRDGRALFMPSTLSNFQDFLYAEQGIFGEEITAVGYPVNEGVGSAYSCNQNFAISAKSKYQDVAWEFLRQYLTDEFQDELEYAWPIKLSSLDKQMEKALKRPTYEDENGNMVEYDDTYYLNGVEVVLNPLTKEDCERVIGFLKSADHVYSYDSNIMTILEEECAAYFEGQKTAQETADIIQSRIHIYVNENM